MKNNTEDINEKFDKLMEGQNKALDDAIERALEKDRN